MADREPLVADDGEGSEECLRLSIKTTKEKLDVEVPSDYTAKQVSKLYFQDTLLITLISILLHAFHFETGYLAYL